MSHLCGCTVRRRPWRIAAVGLISFGLIAGVGGAEAGPAPLAASADSLVTVAVSPYRVLDTRDGTGVRGSTAPLGPGEVIEVRIAGVGPVPSNAVGVVLNLTATQATDRGYVTAWPTGEPRPTTSVLNLTAGQDTPNMVTVLLGDGQLSLYNYAGTVHLLGDIAGYLTPGAGGGAAGPQGPAGPTGPQGPAGAPGVAPTQTLVLSAVGAVSESADFPVHSSQIGCITNPDADGAAGYLWFSLPGGATITATRVAYQQLTVDSTVFLELQQVTSASDLENIGDPFESTDGVVGARTATLNVGSPPPVAADSMYFLRAVLWQGGTVCRVEVDYTMPTAEP